ncbi:MAG: hypothetical protein ACTSYA_10370 [Candidatus Kariarchaeaceae archaeon]|nr:MAG: hypothetical protein DRO61_11295 [Candidatus Bathyarchaeota archaeon]
MSNLENSEPKQRKVHLYPEQLDIVDRYCSTLKGEMKQNHISKDFSLQSIVNAGFDAILNKYPELKA